jgi:glycosyltransferase involved in cell wall biosynthesis
MLGPFADRSLARQVITAVGRLGFPAPTLWINDAHFRDLLRTGWPSTYDITDDWLLASGPGRTRRRLAAAERTLLRGAGGVVVCSPGLAATRQEQRADIAVIPNAADHVHFTRARERPHDLPEGTIAVYVGTLHEDRVDVDLVVELAQSLPDLAVVLVGPSSLGAESVDRLDALANVHRLGARSYDDVPAYLQHADVVIVPHVVSPFTESLDPIKAYECLVVGRPTVATQVAGFRDLGAPVVAADRNGFVAAVEAALTTPTPTRPRPVPTWDERARDFAAVLASTRRNGQDLRS